jgi:hypothetical protein
MKQSTKPTGFSSKIKMWSVGIAGATLQKRIAYGAALGAVLGLGVVSIAILSGAPDTTISATGNREAVQEQVFAPDVSYRRSTENVKSAAQFIGEYVLPEIDPTAQLNAAWGDIYSRFDRRAGMAGVHLSKAGYPVIVTRMPIALCKSPIEVQMARDLIVSGRIEIAVQLPTCLVFTDQVPGEWVGINAFDRNLVTLRLHPKGRPPLDLYGPSPEGSDNPLFGWFGTITQ